MQEQDVIKQIGAQIAKVRKERGLSKYYFQQNGIQIRQLNYIESGSKDYSIKTLIKICNLLKLDLWIHNL